MTRNTRILIVDDDPLMRELASAKLADAGYEVDCAGNGEEAWTRLQVAPAELVIADLDMPVMTGYELTEKMRASRAFRQTPVIVITGSDHAEAVDRAFAVGATSFLAKPVNWSLLSHAAKFVLRAARDQKALRVARDQAEAGARFRDSLMSLMSHELRTPLNAIIGFGQILGERFEKAHDPVHREYADYIVDGGKRLLNSVSDMLLASDARTGPITINDVDCSLQDVADLALAQTEKVASVADAKINFMLHDPDLEIRCDRLLVGRAIGKLIDNSIKFAERGVEIIVATAIVGDGDLAIVVKDNGPGMAPEKVKAATQPFTQLDMSLQRSKEGLGLGLPLVQAIASAHGARFKLETAPDKGVCAILVFPKKRLAVGSVAADTAVGATSHRGRASA
ncbi:MAG: response regulator [Alphaproteobacteria bacterium]|nr:response regulator [Alphaproteobacteria bacterium]